MTTSTKQVGIIGIGKMGGNIARQLHRNGYSLVLYNKDRVACAPFEGKERVTIADDLDDFSRKVKDPMNGAIVWLMVPGGMATNALISRLIGLQARGDILIDGSNSLYTDSINNYELLRQHGISYLDVGCAGGPDDLLNGVSLMVGGDRSAFEKAEDVFRVVCGNGTYGYVGGSGTGHMTKLAHNVIFYGIFPIISEGTELLQAMGAEEPSRKFEIKEALRLLAASPPINNGITRAVSEAYDVGIPEGDPKIAISGMVDFGLIAADKLGVKLSITRAVLAGYGSMSKGSRCIYAAAKKALTGH